MENKMEEMQNCMINLYGVKHQVCKTCEELAELNEILMKYVNKSGYDREHILEEYVDVNFMLGQIKKMFLFTDEEIEQMEQQKLDKIKEMLNNGN